VNLKYLLNSFLGVLDGDDSEIGERGVSHQGLIDAKPYLRIRIGQFIWRAENSGYVLTHLLDNPTDHCS
jgi:hypothetical protein